MPFLNDIAVTDEGFGKSKLLEPLKFYSEQYERTFVVPRGFITDYASIPRLLQLFISKLGRHRKAAAVHDYLYSTATDYKAVTRFHCDKVFYEAMLVEGVPKWKAWSMYRAVRMFGWGSYRK